MYMAFYLEPIKRHTERTTQRLTNTTICETPMAKTTNFGLSTTIQKPTQPRLAWPEKAQRSVELLVGVVAVEAEDRLPLVVVVGVVALLQEKQWWGRVIALPMILIGWPILES